MRLLHITLADGLYGLPVAAVRTIVPWQPVTALPFSPPAVAGVLNLRGTVLPIVDLRARLGLPALSNRLNARIIVVEMDGTSVGLIVDTVLAVQPVAESDVQPVAAEIAATVEEDLFVGVVQAEDALLLWLDLPRLLERITTVL